MYADEGKLVQVSMLLIRHLHGRHVHLLSISIQYGGHLHGRRGTLPCFKVSYAARIHDTSHPTLAPITWSMLRGVMQGISVMHKFKLMQQAASLVHVAEAGAGCCHRLQIR